MYCPSCSQEQTSPDTTFCSRCGYLLTGTAELMKAGGALSKGSKWKGLSAKTPRNRGVKQGLFAILLTMLIVPIVVVLSIAIEAGPVLAEFCAFLLIVGGLLRIAYALLFEANEGADVEDAGATKLFGSAPQASLPAQQSYPAAAYTTPGNRRDTNDLESVSVTESTTRLLEKED